MAQGAMASNKEFKDNCMTSALGKKRIVLTIVADADLASTEDASQLASAVGAALAELLVVRDVTVSFPSCCR
jgi:hypothetical protein